MSKPPYRVTNAYEALLAAFRKVAEDADRNVSFPDRPVPACFTPLVGDRAAVFKITLCIKDLPCRRLPRDKHLHVLINALETLKRVGSQHDSWELTRSTVYLNYVVMTDAMPRLVQALHFDFVEGGQPDHPIFHVELDSECIPLEDLRDAGFDLEPQSLTPVNECWVTTRIPTADMTLASVLYCIVADHLPHFFKEFAETVHPIQERLPSPGFDALKRSLQRSFLHFKSSHWFAHMLELS